MLKKSLFVVAALAMLASVASAGESKFHGWEITKEWVKQEVCTIEVVMDIGYWVRCEPQKMKIDQVDIHKYAGCADIMIECNFDLILTAKISATGAVPGKYSVKLDGGGSANVNAPGRTVEVCVELKEADLGGTTGGAEDVHVANIVMSVVPQAAP